MPSPVMRIAPKPSRLTGRFSPNFQTEFVARLGVVDEAAPNIVADPPANSVAPVARPMPRNVRRVTPLSTGFWFALGDFSAMTRKVGSRQPLSMQARGYVCSGSRAGCDSSVAAVGACPERSRRNRRDLLSNLFMASLFQKAAFVIAISK